MKLQLLIPAALTLALPIAAPAIAQDRQAAPRSTPPSIEALTIAQTQGHEAGRGCTADGKFCLEISGGDDAPQLTLPGEPEGYDLTLLPRADEDGARLRLWPHAIRFDGGVLAGAEVGVSTSYSGGDASASQLHLIAFRPGQPALAVMEVPIRGSATIRACFSPRDRKRRAGACHDEYRFEAAVTPEGSIVGGMPVLRLSTRATSYPGRVSRSADSLERPPLRKVDLVTVTDARCSFERLWRFDADADGYRPETPPPDCADYYDVP